MIGCPCRMALAYLLAPTCAISKLCLGGSLFDVHASMSMHPIDLYLTQSGLSSKDARDFSCGHCKLSSREAMNAGKKDMKETVTLYSTFSLLSCLAVC